MAISRANLYKTTTTPPGKVKKVMREFKDGSLHSGSDKGPVVKDKKQAMAIAMSYGKEKEFKSGNLVPRKSKSKTFSTDKWTEEQKAALDRGFKHGGSINTKNKNGDFMKTGNDKSKATKVKKYAHGGSADEYTEGLSDAPDMMRSEKIVREPDMSRLDSEYSVDPTDMAPPIIRADPNPVKVRPTPEKEPPIIRADTRPVIFRPTPEKEPPIIRADTRPVKVAPSKADKKAAVISKYEQVQMPSGRSQDYNEMYDRKPTPYESRPGPTERMQKKGMKVKMPYDRHSEVYAGGGSVSRGDGLAQRGKTRGKYC